MDGAVSSGKAAREKLAVLVPWAKDRGLWDDQDPNAVTWKVDTENQVRVDACVAQWEKCYRALLNQNDTELAAARSALAGFSDVSTNAKPVVEVKQKWLAEIKIAYESTLESLKSAANDTVITYLQNRLAWWRKELPTETAQWDPIEPDPITDLDEAGFWASVGACPVVKDEQGGSHFTPEFQEWADRYNAWIRDCWSRTSGKTDYVGTVGLDNLMKVYSLNPSKVESLWLKAKDKKVDPRLLLAILKHEGTGSFNTNPDNAGVYGGHGPQPDWDTDLDAAFDTLVVAKLRMYPIAKSAGFQGNFLQYVNWKTPIDRAAGDSGVYAADYFWYDGVSDVLSGLATALKSTSSDPVGDYEHFISAHPEYFEPHVQTGITIVKGTKPQQAAVAPSIYNKNPDRFPDATLNPIDGFYYFTAPDGYYWVIQQ